MSYLKSFLLGVGASYGVYYLTKKGQGGRSILDELLAHPSEFFDRAKHQAIVDVVDTVKDRVG